MFFKYILVLLVCDAVICNAFYDISALQDGFLKNGTNNQTWFPYSDKIHNYAYTISRPYYDNQLDLLVVRNDLASFTYLLDYNFSNIYNYSSNCTHCFPYWCDPYMTTTTPAHLNSSLDNSEKICIYDESHRFIAEFAVAHNALEHTRSPSFTDLAKLNISLVKYEIQHASGGAELVLGKTSFFILFPSCNVTLDSNSGTPLSAGTHGSHPSQIQIFRDDHTTLIAETATHTVLALCQSQGPSFLLSAPDDTRPPFARPRPVQVNVDRFFRSKIDPNEFPLLKVATQNRWVYVTLWDCIGYVTSRTGASPLTGSRYFDVFVQRVATNELLVQVQRGSAVVDLLRCNAATGERYFSWLVRNRVSAGPMVELVRSDIPESRLVGAGHEVVSGLYAFRGSKILRLHSPTCTVTVGDELGDSGQVINKYRRRDIHLCWWAKQSTLCVESRDKYVRIFAIKGVEYDLAKCFYFGKTHIYMAPDVKESATNHDQVIKLYNLPLELDNITMYSLDEYLKPIIVREWNTVNIKHWTKESGLAEITIKDNQTTCGSIKLFDHDYCSVFRYKKSVGIWINDTQIVDLGVHPLAVNIKTVDTNETYDLGQLTISVF